MRLCCCAIALVWLTTQTQAVTKPSLGGKLHGVKKLVTVVSSVALISGASLAAHKPQLDFRYDAQELRQGQEVRALNNEDEIEREWQRVRNNPPPHQAAVFYLLIDGFDIGWRVMHIELIGFSKKGEPLFVGPRRYLLSGVGRNGEPKFVLHWAQPSLVGHDGLIKQNVEIEEITHFSHPYHMSYDQTLITIKDVDLSEYEPLSIAAQPEPGTDLTMLSYMVRDADVLKFFDYPLEQRDCLAVDFDAEDMMVVHSCRIPHTPAVVASPIFAKDTLVALYYGVTDENEAYGSALLPELLNYMEKMLAVEAQGKATTTWAKMKKP